MKTQTLYVLVVVSAVATALLLLSDLKQQGAGEEQLVLQEEAALQEQSERVVERQPVSPPTQAQPSQSKGISQPEQPKQQAELSVPAHTDFAAELPTVEELAEQLADWSPEAIDQRLEELGPAIEESIASIQADGDQVQRRYLAELWRESDALVEVKLRRKLAELESELGIGGSHD